MQILALGIFCIGITHSLPNIGQDDLMDVESDILKAIGHRDGMDYDDADSLMSLLEEANDDLDLEGEEGSAVDEVDEPRMIEPVDPVPTTLAPVGVNRVKPSYNSHKDPIESIEEIKSMQEVKSIEPIKSIEEIESIQEIKSIEEVPDQVAKEFIADHMNKEKVVDNGPQKYHSNEKKVHEADNLEELEEMAEDDHDHDDLPPTKEHILESLAAVIKYVGIIIEDVEKLPDTPVANRLEPVQAGKKAYSEPEPGYDPEEMAEADTYAEDDDDGHQRYAEKEDGVESVQEVKSLQEVKNMDEVKSITPIKSIQEIKQIYQLTDDQAQRLRELNEKARRRYRRRNRYRSEAD